MRTAHVADSRGAREHACKTWLQGRQKATSRGRNDDYIGRVVWSGHKEMFFETGVSEFWYELERVEL